MSDNWAIPFCWFCLGAGVALILSWCALASEHREWVRASGKLVVEMTWLRRENERLQRNLMALKPLPRRPTGFGGEISC